MGLWEPLELNCACENGPLFDDYSFWEGLGGDWMLCSCSLEWVDVFRPLGVHMGPILENWGGWGQGGHQADFTREGGHKYVSLPWWQFWCLGTPKWTKNLVSTHSKLSKMVFAIFLGLSGPELGQIRRPSWKIWDAGVPICITGFGIVLFEMQWWQPKLKFLFSWFPCLCFFILSHVFSFLLLFC